MQTEHHWLEPMKKMILAREQARNNFDIWRPGWVEISTFRLKKTAGLVGLRRFPSVVGIKTDLRILDVVIPRRPKRIYNDSKK